MNFFGRRSGSIRDQILLPTIGLTVMLVGLTGLACGGWVASRAWQERIERGRQIVDTLSRSNFPLTDAVLDQLRGIGGVEFAIVDETGLIQKATQPNLVGARWAGLREPQERGFQTVWTAPSPGSSYRIAWLAQRTADSSSRTQLLVLLPEPALRAAAWEAARAIGLLTVLGAILAAALAVTMGRALAAPLTEISAAIRQIERGEPVAALPRDRSDEIGEVADAVTRLAGRLEVLERDRAEAQRLQLVRQLSAGLAHELRNPLTAARMTLQLLEQRQAGNPAVATPVHLAIGELGRMERQVKRFLQIARPDPPHLAVVDPRQLLMEAIERMAAACELRGHKVELVEGGPTPSLRVDSDQLGQVLINLLQNALDASQAPSVVRVRAISQDSWVVLAVEDEGPGVPHSIADRLFQPFVTTKPEGVGLGLALCASLVREHHGFLRYQRESGITRFEVQLPVEGRDQAERLNPVDMEIKNRTWTHQAPSSGEASTWPM